MAPLLLFINSKGDVVEGVPMLKLKQNLFIPVILRDPKSPKSNVPKDLIYRFLFSFLMVSIFALGCGDRSVEKGRAAFNLNTVNLGQDTVSVQVSLPLTQQEIQQISSFGTSNSQTSAGTFKNRFDSPIPFDQIRMIRAIVIDRNGSKHLMGAATFSQKPDGSASKALSGNIDSIGFNDVIWISDIENSNMFFAYIQFFQNPQIEIGVDLFNGGSLTLANLIQSRAIDISAPLRIYFHFERK